MKSIVMENQSRLITSKEIEIVIKNLPQNKRPAPDGFSGKLYHTYQEALIFILLKTFQKLKEGMLP